MARSSYLTPGSYRSTGASGETTVWTLTSCLCVRRSQNISKAGVRKLVVFTRFYLMRSFPPVLLLPDVSRLNTALKGFTSGWGRFFITPSLLLIGFLLLYLTVPVNTLSDYHPLTLYFTASKKSGMHMQHFYLLDVNIYRHFIGSPCVSFKIVGALKLMIW